MFSSMRKKKTLNKKILKLPMISEAHTENLNSPQSLNSSFWYSHMFGEVTWIVLFKSQDSDIESNACVKLEIEGTSVGGKMSNELMMCSWRGDALFLWLLHFWWIKFVVVPAWPYILLEPSPDHQYLQVSLPLTSNGHSSDVAPSFLLVTKNSS